MEVPDDIATMSFETALAELEQIVQRLEAGDVTLEDSIEIYQRGSLLRAHCEQKLQAAQAKIERVTLDESGNANGTQPLDSD